MKAQWYNDLPKILRVFDGNIKLFDAEAVTVGEADYKLRKLRMKRREKWKHYDWGAEANIRFEPIRKRVS